METHRHYLKSKVNNFENRGLKTKNKQRKKNPKCTEITIKVKQVSCKTTERCVAGNQETYRNCINKISETDHLGKTPYQKWHQKKETHSAIKDKEINRILKNNTNF